MVMVLIATAAVGTICLRKRRSKLRNKTDTADISENVAYGTNMDMSCNVAYDMNQNEMEMSCNVAYVSASFKGDDTYDYIDGNDVVITSSNEAYATTNNGHTEAYGMVHH